MLDETVQICLRMWSGERGDERPFEGRHYRLERPLNLPQSLSRPHPPIMIAGDGGLFSGGHRCDHRQRTPRPGRTCGGERR